MKRQPQRGFSLLEVMIVVAIIMVLSAIAIPNFFRARQNAYEASAAGFLHTVQAEQLAYHASHGTYASSFSQLPGLAGSGSGGAPDSQAGGTPGGTGSSTSTGATSTVLRNSYVYTLVRVNNEQWYVTAFPILDRYDGRYYYTDETGAIRAAKGVPATDSSYAQ